MQVEVIDVCASLTAVEMQHEQFTGKVVLPKPSVKDNVSNHGHAMR